jgi:hypothetical protein
MIEAIYDLTDKEWNVIGSGIDFAVSFTDGDANLMRPDELRFGWTVTVNGEQVSEKFYPEPNVKFVEIRPTAKFYGRVEAVPDEKITFTFFAAQGDNEKVEKQYAFVVPRPEQLFPSWVWEDGQWTPPVPYPDDGGFYAWDENGQIWATVDPISE